MHFFALVFSLTVLDLTSVSNPTNAEVQLTIDSYFIDATDKDFTLEVWFYPSLSATGMQFFRTPELSLTRNGSTSEVQLLFTTSSIVVCSYSNVSSNTWIHFAITRTGKTYVCYRDASATVGVTMGNATPATNTNIPQFIWLGKTYIGSMRELRVWVPGQTVANLQAYFHRYFSDSEIAASSTINNYFRLTDPTSITAIYDSKRQASFSATAFTTSALWRILTEVDFVCALNEYISSGCKACNSFCDRCTGPGITQCTQSKAQFNRGLKQVTLKLGATSANSNTYEVWVYANSFTSASQPIINFSPLISVLRQGTTTYKIDFVSNNNVVVTSTDFPIATWKHLTIVKTTNNGASPVLCTVYMDTVLVYSGQWTTNVQPVTFIFLGQNQDGGLYFDGFLRDVRVWNIARSQAEIANFMYVSFASPFPTSLTNYFQLLEGASSTRLVDSISGVSLSDTNLSSMWATMDCSQRTCLIECPMKTYSAAGGVCTACDVSCQLCSGPTVSQCIVCDSAYQMQIPNLNTCLKSCPSGYFVLGTTKQCVVSCPNYYYQSSTTACTSCFTSCLTCSGPNTTQCVTCPTGFTLTVTNTCLVSCTPGLYPDAASNTCKSCDTSCATCNSGSSSNCQSCTGTAKLYKTTCYGTCPAKTFVSTSLCLDCYINCLTCSGTLETNCLTCDSSSPNLEIATGKCYLNCPKYRNTSLNTCVEACPTNHYLQVTDCRLCHTSCLTCGGPEATACISCAQGQFLSAGTCLAQCPSNTYIVGANCLGKS